MRLIAVLFLAMIAPAAASEVAGTAQIVDADTVYIGRTKIRLQGVDAPEMDQACLDGADKPWRCGIDARSALEVHSAGRPWRCEISGIDRYGSDLATCFIGSEDLNAWLVRQGWAMAFRRYSTAYVAEEDAAKTERKGLWGEHLSRHGTGGIAVPQR